MNINKHIYYLEQLTGKKVILAENLKTANEFILYRGAGLTEVTEACKLGYLPYYSEDAMSEDWEVIKYGLGDAASEMSEKEVEDYVNELVSWNPKNKGINLTSDLGNAKGYSDIVLEIIPTGDYAQFSNTHYFAQSPKECIVKSVYYKEKNYSKKDFLKLIKNKKV